MSDDRSAKPEGTGKRNEVRGGARLWRPEHRRDDQSVRSTASVRGAEPGEAVIPCIEERERRRRIIKSLNHERRVTKYLRMK